MAASCETQALSSAVEAAFGGGGQLSQDEPGVADDSDIGGAIVADLLAVEIDADEFADSEKRGARKKESIEFARAPITNTTSASRNAVERAAGKERVIFGNDAAALRSGEERHPVALDEMAQCGLGARPDDAAAGNQIGRLARVRGIRRAFHYARGHRPGRRSMREFSDTVIFSSSTLRARMSPGRSR